jgi:uncharacterized membrane protein YdjX (TVP38/TMEM64 family)
MTKRIGQRPSRSFAASSPIHPQALFQQLVHLIEGLGPAGYLACVPLYILGTLVFIPNTLLAFTAGALFPLPMAFLLVSVSSTLSATGVFWAGRTLSRNWLLKKIALSRRTTALNEAVTHEGWKMVALLRQTAVLPFSLMNYALGLSKIPYKDYVLASWIGMMPGQILYVYLGSMAGEIALGGRPSQKTTAEWVFFALGVLVTIGMGIYAAKRVQKIFRTATSAVGI